MPATRHLAILPSRREEMAVMALTKTSVAPARLIHRLNDILPGKKHPRNVDRSHSPSADMKKQVPILQVFGARYNRPVQSSLTVRDDGRMEPLFRHYAIRDGSGKEVFECGGNVLSRAGEVCLVDRRGEPVFTLNRKLDDSSGLDVQDDVIQWNVYSPHHSRPRAMRIKARLDDAGVVTMDVHFKDCCENGVLRRRSLLVRGISNCSATVHLETEENKLIPLGRIYPATKSRRPSDDVKLRIDLEAGVDLAAMVALALCYEVYCKEKSVAIESCS